MPWVDLVDETFVVAPPAVVAAELCDPAAWCSCWPDLDLAVHEDRGVEGVRWTCTGALVGSCEVWLEPWCDGVLVHVYLRADVTAPGSATRGVPLDGPDGWRRAVPVRERWARATKARLFALKDELEAGREVGVGPAPLTSAAVAAGSAAAPVADRSATMPDGPAPTVLPTVQPVVPVVSQPVVPATA